MKKEARNAVIRRVHLGPEGHGIPSAMLMLDYGGMQQGFGGYDLRHPEHARNFIWRTLEVVGVDDWSKLVGQPCRASIVDDMVRGIGHIIEDRWYYPEAKFADAMLAAEKKP